jgi:hypothetical protein
MTTRENRCADRGGFWSFIVTPGFKVGRGKDTIATQRTLFMMADAVFNDFKKTCSSRELRRHRSSTPVVG